MKNQKLYIAALLSALIALPIASQARPGGHGGGHHGGGHHGSDNGYYLAKYDSDGDGVVTLAEIQAVRQADFSNADADANGYLDASELQALQAAEKTARVTYKFNSLDTDANGNLSATEFAANTGRLSDADVAILFGLADANADTVLSSDEFIALKTTEAGRAWKHFVKMDQDDNNQVSQAEYVARVGRGERD